MGSPRGRVGSARIIRGVGAQNTGFKTTFYYSPEGAFEGAYLQIAEGKPVRKAEPDPRYLVSVYFDENGKSLGVRVCERVPQEVLDAAMEMLRGASAGVMRRFSEAVAAGSAA